MTGYFISSQFGYYEGDQISSEDIAVPQRPSSLFVYTDDAWSIDPTKLEAAIAVEIQLMLDTKAESLGYTDCMTACTYVPDPNNLWSRQGVAFVAWRSAIWTQAYSDMADIKDGNKAMPASITDYLATLPASNIPES